MRLRRYSTHSFRLLISGLLTDPHKGLQLTTPSFLRAVSYIRGLGDMPTVFVGGGGYHPPSTAKHFALLTALVLEKTLDEDIPLEAQYWEELERDGDGRLHIGRDLQLTTEGEFQVEGYYAALKQRFEN